MPWYEEIPTSAVIHLLPSLDDATGPPLSMRYHDRPGSTTRRVTMGIAYVVAAGCVGLCVLLWSAEDTPGAWFNAIFTVMLGGSAVAIVLVVRDWHVTAISEAEARATWASGPAPALSAGHVLDRRVNISGDSGRVTGFGLQVATADARGESSGDRSVIARWHDIDDEGLLQSQVPGVGSPVQIWQSDLGPLVVEVADPSVVRHRPRTDP